MESGEWKVESGKEGKKWISWFWIYPLSTLYFLLSVFVFAGCATIGPQVSRQEIDQARKELQAKALRYKFSQQIRLNQLGYRLVSHLPAPQDSVPRPYVGLLLADVSRELKEFYHLNVTHGVVVVGVVPESPAEKAGFKTGDLIAKIGKAKPQSAWEALQLLRKIKPGETRTIEIAGADGKALVDLAPTSAPYWIRFMTADSDEVNAFAEPEQIVVTYGMLRFIHSDDELAVVLGHELAHLTQGHIAKSMGSGILAGILGLTVGVGAEILLPGSGDSVSRLGSGLVGARFSKDYEREADYIGLKYVHAAGFDIRAGVAVWERFGVEIPQTLSSNFLSTHPPSPERMVRVQKMVEELLGPIQQN